MAVEADVEIGGNDQLFNLMSGRMLQKAYGQNPQSLITYHLLEGTDGRKMSTTWGNTIYITDEANDMYGKLMSIPDHLIAKYFELCTDVDMQTVEAAVKTIADGANPRDVKASLARAVVAVYYDDKVAAAAEQEFNHVFRDKNNPTEIKELKIKLSDVITATDLVTASGVAGSNSEANRLIEQKAVRLNDRVVSLGDELKPKSGDILNIGRRYFARLKIQ